jgi:peptidoglycan hydrolase CwlO-like protein
MESVEIMSILTVIGGVMLAVIGFFLRQTMDELKDIKTVAYKNQTRIEVMENRFSNIDDKMDDLKDAVKELTGEIKMLNTKIKQ